ncbi:MAG: aminotransferase class V-fold PLP-dependent enzyme [Streptosporangiales bacterium]|nr:aminotransferase class V-fold PLP-dependent enzyme [Streptosporangiales bacterium]
MELSQLVRREWPEPPPGHFAAPTIGLPTQSTLRALHTELEVWAGGDASAPGYDTAVERCRELYAKLVGVPGEWVAVGNQVSVWAGLVAAALPDGADVVVPAGDFSSVVYPFLVHADRGVRVRHVPLAELADAVRTETTLVAYSLAQSATGEVADADAVRDAATAAGALTMCDVTQAAGWLPVDASRFDITVCGGYKWLCHPRGTAFLTVRPERLDWLRPLYAGWYAGESRWDSIYGPEMQLASTAQRFDISPAWHCWVGAVPALELFTSVPPAEVYAHDSALADLLRKRVGADPTGSAIVTLPDPEGSAAEKLRAAGCAVSARAGNVRLGFHLWNTEADVDLAVAALQG